MAIKFQYNKTSRQQLIKGLEIRKKALPTLQAKEAALRNEVKLVKVAIKKIESEIQNRLETLADLNKFWCEFPDLLTIKEVQVGRKSIAGVKTPFLEKVVFEEQPFSLHANPNWLKFGVKILKMLIGLRIEIKILTEKFSLLDYARKKTTQKVNLYEKVQIPEYDEAILKIKRYLEDEENLAKSSQKILKAKIEREAAA
jgi:V/A-type H+-transporting ATPase subunit D